MSHRTRLICRILQGQGALPSRDAEVSRPTSDYDSGSGAEGPPDESLEVSSVLAWMGMAYGGVGPQFPLLPAVKLVARALGEAFGVSGE